ncbi:MAG: Inorganic pyrophosphatase [uncultured bacterium]|nr:MAG: Inorganic pyrophosphatase [uncultured bacterium]
MDSKSLSLAKGLLGKKVKIKIDRQLGSKHPKWGFNYDVNYGYIEGIIAPDGEELDAYLLKVDRPVEEFEGIVVAIVHRTDNDDDKIVVIPEGENVTDEEIESLTQFQEKFFKHIIVRSDKIHD